MRLRGPLDAPRDAHRRKREALVVALDPVEIIVTGAREADHFPRAHVAIAAIDRVGEEALLDILDKLLEEILALGAFELEVAALQSVQHLVLVVVGKLGERPAAELRLAGAVERGESVAINLHISAFGLRSLLF